MRGADRVAHLAPDVGQVEGDVAVGATQQLQGGPGEPEEAGAEHKVRLVGIEEGDASEHQGGVRDPGGRVVQVGGRLGDDRPAARDRQLDQLPVVVIEGRGGRQVTDQQDAPRRHRVEDFGEVRVVVDGRRGPSDARGMVNPAGLRPRGRGREQRGRHVRPVPGARRGIGRVRIEVGHQRQAEGDVEMDRPGMGGAQQ